jgi:hypothetical protein
MQKKNSLRINGTTFNKTAVVLMKKDDFIKRYLPIENVLPSSDPKKREEQLGEAYDLLTKK